jgi:hypothetical protein
MGKPGSHPADDAVKGPVARPDADTDSSSASAGVDLEKQSGEGIGRTPTGSSDDETPVEEEHPPISRQRTHEDDNDGHGTGNSVLSRVASRVVTKVSTKSSWNPGPPPDGGLQAWIAGKQRPSPYHPQHTPTNLTPQWPAPTSSS